MRQYLYTFVTVSLAMVYWLIDSSIHWIIFDEELEFIPTEPNELWMRTAIVVMLMTLGIFADIKTRQLLLKEEEKHRVFRASMYSTQHILNNLMNQMTYIKLKLDEKYHLDDELRELIDQTIDSGSRQVSELNQLEDISEESIRQTVYPKAK